MTSPRDERDRGPTEEGRADVPGLPRRRLWLSRSPGRVVARYTDGRVVKGYADFDPGRPWFRLVPVDGLVAEPVRVTDLKAVFFVRRFAGQSEYTESKDLYQARPPGTRKVRVVFGDGEALVGYTRDDPWTEPGFFFTPLDARSNNLKVFAVLEAVQHVERLL